MIKIVYKNGSIDFINIEYISCVETKPYEVDNNVLCFNVRDGEFIYGEEDISEAEYKRVKKLLEELC